MTFDQIINFRKVIETGSTTKAADELFLSRQGLRNSITRLENELGAPLLERTRSGLVPTDFGRYFAQETDALNDILTGLESSYERYVRKTSGTLRVLYTSMSRTLMDQVEDMCDYFSAAYPDAHVELENIYSAIPVTEELFDTYDVVVRYYQENDFCVHIPLPQIEYRACIGRSHRLFEKTALTLEDISEEMFTTGSVNAPIYEWLKMMDTPDSRIYFDKGNDMVKKALVSEGLAIAFISVSHMDKYIKLFGENVKLLPMYPSLIMQDTMYISKVKMSEKDVLKLFYESCQRYIAQKAM